MMNAKSPTCCALRCILHCALGSKGQINSCLVTSSAQRDQFNESPYVKPLSFLFPLLIFLPFSQPSTNTLSQSPAPAPLRPAEAKPSPAAAPSSESGRARLEPDDEANAQLDELRGQMKDLLMSVELLKAQQT